MHQRSMRQQLAIRSFQPRFENLEDRVCPSVTVTTIAIHGGNEPKIVGDSGADTVDITDQGNGSVAVTDGTGAALGRLTASGSSSSRARTARTSSTTLWPTR